jgi:hypothetical protein
MTNDSPATGDQEPTHTAWTPIFDEDGNFVRSVEIGYGFFETDANGKVTWQTFRDRNPLGYDSGFVWLLPHGEQPPAPPPEVLEDARYEAQQKKKIDAAMFELPTLNPASVA